MQFLWTYSGPHPSHTRTRTVSPSTRLSSRPHTLARITGQPLSPGTMFLDIVPEDAVSKESPIKVSCSARSAVQKPASLTDQRPRSSSDCQSWGRGDTGCSHRLPARSSGEVTPTHSVFLSARRTLRGGLTLVPSIRSPPSAQARSMCPASRCSSRLSSRPGSRATPRRPVPCRAALGAVRRSH